MLETKLFKIDTPGIIYCFYKLNTKDFQINHLHKELQDFSLKNKNKKRKEKKKNNMRYLKSQKFLLEIK